jgi:hypothetical protein
MVSRNVSRNAFRCFAKQKGSFRLFRCFAKQAVSANAFRETPNITFVSRKTKQKEVWSQSKLPYFAIISRNFQFFTVSRNVSRNAFRCFAKQKRSFRLFRETGCFGETRFVKHQNSNFVSRKTKQKEVWSQPKLPYFAIISRNLLVFHCFAKRMRNKRKISRNSRSFRLFRCFAKRH